MGIQLQDCGCLVLSKEGVPGLTAQLWEMKGNIWNVALGGGGARAWNNTLLIEPSDELRNKWALC